jgi:putative phosphoribosyl transferase
VGRFIVVSMPFPPTAMLDAGGVAQPIDLELPDEPVGVVIGVHGAGGGRASTAERYIAYGLRAAGFATLAVDHGHDDRVAAIAGGVIDAIGWLHTRPDLAALPIGISAAGIGAAGALVAAARVDIAAIVARGGRPDLAGAALLAVQTPTLFVVGAGDTPVLTLTRRAVPLMPAAALEVVDGAGHRFTEAGALDQVVDLAIEFFHRHLARPRFVAGPLWMS